MEGPAVSDATGSDQRASAVDYLGGGLEDAAAILDGEADELAGRRPHPDAHLYDVEDGLRRAAERARETLRVWYYE